MADDPWAQYRVTEEDEKTLPIPSFKKAGEVDPWDKYRFNLEDQPVSDPKLAKAKQAIQETPYNFMRNVPIMGPVNRAVEDIVNPSLAKGQPGGRHFVPQTPELSKFENEHNYTAKGLNALGLAGTMFAPAAGVASRTATFGSHGGTFVPHLATQTAFVNGPANILDTYAAKNKGNPNPLEWQTPKPEELQSALKRGVAESALPAALTGTIGQAGRASTRDLPLHMVPARERLLQGAGYGGFGGTNRSVLGRTFPPRSLPEKIPSADQQILESTIRAAPWAPRTAAAGTVEGVSPAVRNTVSDIFHSLGGAYLGHKIGGPGETLVGALLGHGLNPALSRIERGITSFGRQPSTQDVIRALMMQGTNTTQPTNP